MKEGLKTFRDLTYSKVGDLFVMGYAGPSKGSQKGATWNCRCEKCGIEFTAITQKIKYGCFKCNDGSRKRDNQ